MVIAQYEDSGVTGVFPVTAIMQRQTAAALYLTLENAAGETSQLGVTAEHPLFDVAAGWTQAGELAAGDQVADADMQPLTVLAIVVDDTPQLVHNLEVGGAHTYFAGDMNAWAHNARSSTSGNNSAAGYGREQHRNYRPGLGGECRLPSGRRADAIDWVQRIVYELKPNTPPQLRRGGRQVARYVCELENLTGEDWTGVVETYPPFK